MTTVEIPLWTLASLFHVAEGRIRQMERRLAIDPLPRGPSGGVEVDARLLVGLLLGLAGDLGATWRGRRIGEVLRLVQDGFRAHEADGGIPYLVANLREGSIAVFVAVTPGLRPPDGYRVYDLLALEAAFEARLQELVASGKPVLASGALDGIRQVTVPA